MKLLIVGSVAYDSLETPFKKINRTLGGSGSYFSLAASYFTKPSIVAVVGDDFAISDKKLLAKHADISGLSQAQGKTFHWAGRYHFDLNTRDTLKTELGVFENFKPQLSSAHKKSEYLFLGNIHPKLQMDVLNQATDAKFVGLDTMNYWIGNAKKDLEKVLKLVNILIINDGEAREFSGEPNLIKAAKKIMGVMGKMRNKTLIIKRGEYGLLMFSSPAFSKRGSGGVNMFHLPGYPLENVTDPTGAGDSFAGGFMGYLAASNDISWNNLKHACVAGSVLASFCCEKLGTAGLLNLNNSKIKQRIKDFKNLTNLN